MKVFLKIIFWLLLLLTLTVIGITLTFDPNDYKNDIIGLVKKQTGRTLAIPGKISLSVFPWIGIDLGAIQLSNAKGFGDKPFASMKHLQVRAKLWPLLQQKLEADTILIDGLELNLAKNQQGISNWDDLSGQTSSSPAKPSEATTSATKEKINSKNILAAIALNGIKIENAQFNWHDQQLKQKFSVNDVQLNLGKLRPETKIPLSLQFHVKENSLDATISLKTAIHISSSLEQISLSDTEISSALSVAGLKRKLTPQLNSALMQLDINQQTFNTKQLTITENNLSITTKVAVEKLSTQPYFTAQVNINRFNPRETAKSFAITLPAMSDNKALTQLSAQLNVNGHAKDLKLQNIELSLDDTRLVGNARYQPMPASSSLNIVIDQVNLDRYLPEPVKSEKPNKQAKTTATEAAIIPLALLSLVNADAKLKIEKFQVKNTHWKNLDLVAHSKNGYVQVKPLTLDGYGATVKTALNIKRVKNTATLSGDINIENIEAGQLINDLLQKDKLKGRTTIMADFSSKGIKLSELKQNLNGKLQLQLKEGTLKGFDLHHEQKVLEAKVKRQPEPKAPVPAETKIANLTASAVINNGLLTNKDLRAATPLSRVIGHGTVNIPKEQINYTASAKFTSSKDIKANRQYEKMDAVPLNIYVRGTFEQPDIKVDYATALKQLLKKEADKYKKKLTDEKKARMKEKLDEEKDKLKDKLKNLFKF